MARGALPILEDDSTYEVESADAPLTPAHFGFPNKGAFSPEEIAERFDVSASTVYRAISDGEIRAIQVRVGGSLRVPMLELRHFLMRNAAAGLFSKN